MWCQPSPTTSFRKPDGMGDSLSVGNFFNLTNTDVDHRTFCLPIRQTVLIPPGGPL